MSAEQWSKRVRVKTHRSGVFVFQAGVDIQSLQALIDRVEDAHKRFSSVPLIPDVMNMLENEVLASSVHGTNAIEGGTLSAKETAEALDLSLEQVKKDEERRVINIREAYQLAENFVAVWRDTCEKENTASFFWLAEEMVLDLHKLITDGLRHPRNVPGAYRDNPKDAPTLVGDARHGGIYKPPRCLADIKMLMGEYVEWINSEPIDTLLPLIRAPLAHLYFELIHPFWDGNGRVGRIFELMILKTAGYKYASQSLSDYYNRNIDEYFLSFNLARKAAESKQPYPNNLFIEFFLKGMLEVINVNHDLANQMTARLLYESRLRSLSDRKEVNHRQYAIVSALFAKGHKHNLLEVQAEPWYKNLYQNLTRHTAARDLKGLVEKQLIKIDKDKTLRLLIP